MSFSARRWSVWTAVGAVVSVGCGGSPASPSMNGAGTAGSAGTATQDGVSGSPGAAGSSNGSSGAGGDGGGGAASVAGSAGQSSAGAAGAAGGGGTAPVDGGLRMTPSELVFGAVQQTTTDAQVISLENLGPAALTLTSLELDGAGATAFELVSPPAAGAALAVNEKLEVAVRFHPGGIALFESGVVLETSDASKSTALLFGLGTKGLEGENEPYLKIVLDTLGYAVDVGGSALLSTTTPLVGTEVAALRFKAAAAGMIELVPVARYSPQEPIPYGYYTAQGEVEVGVIADDQYQALNPTTDAGSKLSFASFDGDFGIYTTSKTHKTYTEDSKNAANAIKHAVRTYPLKDRAGTAVANAYLVCFEEAANGDYQDYVFTLSNVVPVAP